ncbi:MAG: DUF1801 domain-containing protein [Bacteroidota bacterium]
MSTARLGTFDDLLAELPPEAAPHVAPTARTLRAVIVANLPEAVEVVRLGDRAASYGVGLKKMSESHVYVSPQRTHVNLGFWHGVDVLDPEGLLGGTGKRLRHIKVRSVEEAEWPEIHDLIGAALAERQMALRR